MSTILEERQKNRWLLLRKIYEITEGLPDKDNINVYRVGEQLGWNTEEIEATFDYLQGEGLLQGVTVGGGIKLTHKGIKEVEEYPNKLTLDFPNQNVNVGIYDIAANRVVEKKVESQIEDFKIPAWLLPILLTVLFLVLFSVKPENVLIIGVIKLGLAMSATALSLRFLVFNQKS